MLRHTAWVKLGALALSVCAVGVTTTACGGAESSEGAQNGAATVRVMMFPGQAYRLLPLVADQKGFFAERGIAMEITKQPPSLQGIQGLYATKSDVGEVTVATLGQGVQAGDQAKFFCGGIDVLQTTLMAPTDSALPSIDNGATWQDVLQSLQGKKIGIQTPVGSGLQLIFAAALKEAGVTDVTYVNLGGGANGTIAALENGSVDVAQTNPPTTQYFEQAGRAKSLLYLAEGPTVYKDFYGWTAPQRWLEENPKTASDLCAAMTESLAWIQNPQNHAEASQIFQKDTGLEAATATSVVETAFADFSTELDKQVLTNTFDAYTELGIFKPEPALAYDDLIDDKTP